MQHRVYKQGKTLRRQWKTDSTQKMAKRVLLTHQTKKGTDGGILGCHQGKN